MDDLALHGTFILDDVYGLNDVQYQGNDDA